MVFDEAMPAPSHPYVAFYHLTTDDPQKAVDEMKKNVETGVIGLTDAIELDFLTYCYEAASPIIEEQ